MKLKNKLILIFILFAGFVMFNNSDCFAKTYYLSDSQTNRLLYDARSCLDSYYNSFIIYEYTYDSSTTQAVTYLYNRSVATTLFHQKDNSNYRTIGFEFGQGHFYLKMFIFTAKTNSYLSACSPSNQNILEFENSSSNYLYYNRSIYK